MAEEAQAMKSPQPEAGQPDDMSDRAKNAQTKRQFQKTYGTNKTGS